jgi:hypothetical protein
VSHGDIITALLEGIVERKTSTEKYYALPPAPASLSIIKIEESLPSSYTIITGRCLRITRRYLASRQDSRKQLMNK